MREQSPYALLNLGFSLEEELIISCKNGDRGLLLCKAALRVSESDLNLFRFSEWLTMNELPIPDHQKFGQIYMP